MRTFVTLILTATIFIWILPYVCYRLTKLIIEEHEQERSWKRNLLNEE